MTDRSATGTSHGQTDGQMDEDWKDVIATENVLFWFVKYA